MSKAQNAPNLMVPLIVAGFLLLGVGLSVVVGPIYGWGVLAAGVFASMSIGRPRLILVLCLLWSAVTEFATSISASPLIRFADEMILLVILGTLIMIYISQRPSYPDLRRFSKMTVLLLTLTLLSAVLNLVPASRVVHFFLSYLSFIPVFYLAYDAFKPQDYRYILSAFLLLFFLQFGLNLAWWGGLLPRVGASRSAVDFAVGTLGVCNLVAYFSVVVIISSLAAWRVYSGPIRHMLYAGLAVCAVIQLYITYTLHAFVPLLGGLAVYYLLVFKELRHRWLPLAGGTVVLCLLLMLIVAGESGYQLPSRDALGVGWDYVTFRGIGVLEGPKGQTMQHLIRLVPTTSPLVPIIGGGPGNFLSSIGIINVVPMARDAMGDYFLTYTGRMEMASGSILQHPVTGYLALYSELGLLGLLLYMGLHVHAFSRVTRQLVRREYTHPTQRLMAQVYVVSAVVFWLINLLADFFHIDFFQVSIWLLAACVWIPHHEAEPADERAGEERDVAPRRSLLSHLYRPVSSLSPVTSDSPEKGSFGPR
jgi:hypothetical protein